DREENPVGAVIDGESDQVVTVPTVLRHRVDDGRIGRRAAQVPVDVHADRVIPRLAAKGQRQGGHVSGDAVCLDTQAVAAVATMNVEGGWVGERPRQRGDVAGQQGLEGGVAVAQEGLEVPLGAVHLPDPGQDRVVACPAGQLHEDRRVDCEAQVLPDDLGDTG